MSFTDPLGLWHKAANGSLQPDSTGEMLSQSWTAQGTEDETAKVVISVTPTGRLSTLAVRGTARICAAGIAKLAARQGLKQAGEALEKSIGSIILRFGQGDNQVYHAFRHIDELGLDRSLVKNAVEGDLAPIAAKIPVGQLYKGNVVVNGVSLQYNAFKFEQGLVNIGRIKGP